MNSSFADAVRAAHARLDAKPGWTLTCPRCGHADGVPDDPARSVYTCSECSCRIAFGVEMPRIVDMPHEDRRFVVARFQTGQREKLSEVAVTLDREYAAEFALDLLSVCEPVAHAAAVAALKRVYRDTKPSNVPERVPGPAADTPREVARLVLPAPDDPEPGKCQCGAPSAFANGACGDCFARAVCG